MDGEQDRDGEREKWREWQKQTALLIKQIERKREAQLWL